jgi:ketosteroid isomerase-like protein
LLDCYTEDVEINESPALPYGGVYRGHDGVRRHAAAFMQVWARLQPVRGAEMDPKFADLDDDTVVAVFRHRAVAPRTGARLDTPQVGVYELRDGRVCRSRMFHFDPNELVRFVRSAQRL